MPPGGILPNLADPPMPPSLHTVSPLNPSATYHHRDTGDRPYGRKNQIGDIKVIENRFKVSQCETV